MRTNEHVSSIEDNERTGEGASILRVATIRDNTLIGTNTAAMEDILGNCIAVGIPVKVIRSNIDIEEYRDW